MAFYCGVIAHVKPHAKIRINAFTDNVGNRKEIERGWSTRAGHFVQFLVAQQYPKLIVKKAVYVPGTEIPADEPSRGMPVNSQKLIAFCAKHKVPARDEGVSARDLSHRTLKG